MPSDRHDDDDDPILEALMYFIFCYTKANIPKIKEIIQNFLFLVHNQLSDVRSVNMGGAELLEDAGIFSCQVCVESFFSDKINTSESERTL